MDNQRETMALRPHLKLPFKQCTPGPPPPPTFISTASPISFPFLRTATEPRSCDCASSDSKFSCDVLPARPSDALSPIAKRALEDPQQACKDQDVHEPAERARQQGSIEDRPFEPELSENMPAVQHPVPAGVSHQRRQNDRAHAFRDRVAEEELQRGDEKNEHEDLPQFDADIEGQKRGQQMRSGELQRLPQGERKTKTVYQAKTKSHHPAALQAAGDDDS